MKAPERATLMIPGVEEQRDMAFDDNPFV